VVGHTLPMRASLLALLSCLACVGCAFGGDGQATFDEADLRVLVLQQEDLPRVFLRFDEGRQITADLPTGARAAPGRFGRVGGWKARFRRPGSQTTTGALVIESRCDLFESADGAEDELRAVQSEPTADPAQWRPVDAPRVGDESFAMTATEAAFGGGVRYYLIVWREDNVTASILANGFDRKFTLTQALGLARRQHARILRRA
jgi:hypothetical protein